MKLYQKGLFIVVIMGFLICVPSAYADEASEASLTHINVLPIQSGSTEIVLDFNEPVAHKAFLLSHPDRLVIDFPGTVFKSQDKKLDIADTSIKDFRHGVQNGIDLRLVFDLSRQMDFNSTSKTANGFELIFSLNTPNASGATKAVTDQATIGASSAVSPVSATSVPSAPQTTSAVSSSQVTATTVSSTNQTTVAQAPNVSSSTTVTVDSTKVAKADAKADLEDASSLIPSVEAVPSKSKHLFTVVIDAGHGGKDPGTTGPDGDHEKNITLSIADDLEKLVNAQPGMHAVMTRDGDYYVGLRERLMLARKDKGDIFVAIHADAYTEPDATGASVFALSLHGASSEQALWLAKKENYSELSGIDLNGIKDQDSELRSVLIDLSQTATIGASLQLGDAVIKQLGGMTSLHHGFVEQAPFMVLKSPDIPSILVETGFLSNPKEEKRLCSTCYQKQLAKAIFMGIQQYYTQDVPRHMSIATVAS